MGAGHALGEVATWLTNVPKVELEWHKGDLSETELVAFSLSQHGFAMLSYLRKELSMPWCAIIEQSKNTLWSVPFF